MTIRETISQAWGLVSLRGKYNLSDLVETADLIFTEVAGCYLGPERHYHHLGHVQDCVRQAAQMNLDGAARLALWYHDVVYEAGAKDNEQASADRFARDANLLGVGASAIRTVQDLILATRHVEQANQPDDSIVAMVVDIDLSGMGRSYELFCQNDQAIRLEFSHASDQDWLAGRAKFLHGLLTRGTIFRSVRFVRDGYEARARSNIMRWLADRKV